MARKKGRTSPGPSSDTLRRSKRITQLQPAIKDDASHIRAEIRIKPDSKSLHTGAKRKFEDSEVADKSRKRAARATQPNKRRTQAGLWMMTEMPIDVLHEIFGHLEPYDLLRLARTTRALRDILMRRSSRDIWATSFASMEGYPPCPDGMAEPQYANLMFSYHCHACGLEPDRDGPILYMFMEARTQFCAGCSKKKFIPWPGLPVKVPKVLAEFVPATTQPFHRSRWGNGVTSFYVETALELHDQYISLGDNEDAKKEWLEKQKLRWTKIAEHAELCEVYMRGRLEYEEAVIQENLREQRRIRSERTMQITAKMKDLGWAREIEFQDKEYSNGGWSRRHAMRFQDHKLVDQFVELTDREWKRILPQLVKWLQEIRAKLTFIDHQEIVRTRTKKWVEPIYIAHTLGSLKGVADGEAVAAYGDTQHFFPSLIKVCLMEEFRHPLEDKIQTPEEDFSEETFKAGALTLPAFIENWRNAKIEGLLNVIRRSKVYSSNSNEEPGVGTKYTPTGRGTTDGVSSSRLESKAKIMNGSDMSVDPSYVISGADVSRDTLKHATTVFRCLECNVFLVYPSVLSHDCLYSTPTRIKQPKPDEQQKPKAAAPAKGKGQTHLTSGDLITSAFPTHRVWSLIGDNSQPKLTLIDLAVFQHIRVLLDLHGLPHSTTRGELEALDPYVHGTCTCFGQQLQFPTPSAKGLVLDKHSLIHWTQIPDYSRLHKKREPYAGSFELPSANNKDIRKYIKEKQAVHKRNTLRHPRGYSGSVCFVCTERGVFVKDHLVSKHGASEEDAKRYVRGETDALRVA